jgi:hypothetical protein
VERGWLAGARPGVAMVPQRPLTVTLRRHRRLRTGVTQLVYVLLAFGLAMSLPDASIGFTVSSQRVIDLSIAIGIGIVTFIGVVYSLLFLVVQFSTTTFTQRLNLFRDAPIVWHAFSFFTGLIVCRSRCPSRSGPPSRRPDWCRSSWWCPS